MFFWGEGGGEKAYEQVSLKFHADFYMFYTFQSLKAPILYPFF